MIALNAEDLIQKGYVHKIEPPDPMTVAFTLSPPTVTLSSASGLTPDG